MTEVELSLVLGILQEPPKNRLPMTPELKADIQHLTTIFSLQKQQKRSLPIPSQQLWLDFLPWHSVN